MRISVSIFAVCLALDKTLMKTLQHATIDISYNNELNARTYAREQSNETTNLLIDDESCNPLQTNWLVVQGDVRKQQNLL